MRHRITLPDTLGDYFTVSQAADAGIQRGRLAASDLARPFTAVRAVEEPVTAMQRLRALAPRLRAWQLVTGATALHAWGYPHPGIWSIADDIEVVVPTDAVRPRLRGVKSSRLARSRMRAWRIGPVPIVDPLTALFTCAPQLVEDDLVVLCDALMTDADNYPGLRKGRPVVTAEDIESRMQEWGPFPGCAGLRAAVLRARTKVESPKETRTRLLLVANGLEEPAVQHVVRDRGRFVARVDLAYPDLKIAIEYEGDGHRRSPKQWRRDIQRQRELEDLGWIVIRVTELDLSEGASSLLTRIRNAIASR